MTSLKHTLLAASLLLPAATAGASTFQVPRMYGTIQEAVSLARPGDTIEIGPGSYAEDVIVSSRRGITFKPRSPGTVTIRSMALAYSHETRILDLNFSGSSGGLLSLFDCDGSLIKGCRFENASAYGLSLLYSDRTTVEHCTVGAQRTGMSVASASKTTVKYNRFSGSSTSSLYLSRVSQASIVGNRFDNTGLVDVRSSDGAYLFANQLTGSRMRLSASSDLTVENNSFKKTAGVGLLLEQCSGARLAHNLFNRCAEAMQILGGGGHTVQSNKVKKCLGYGIRIWSSGNLFKKNTARKSGIQDLWDSNPGSNRYRKNRLGKSNL